MSAVGAVAANICPTKTVSLQDVQSDPALFLDSKKLVSVTKTSGDTDDDDNNSGSEPDNASVSKSVNHDDNNESLDSE
jgi:hypothetical protein